MNLPPLYCISGMGVDAQIFSHLRVEGRELRHVPWLEPKRKESIGEYARRMAAQIPESGPVELLGLSFGGIIAVEIAQQRPVDCIFLVSSIKSRKEKPWSFRIMRYLPFYLTNIQPLRDRTTWAWGRFFGLHTKAQVREFYGFMPGLSDHYMRWAVRQICRWKNEHGPVEVHHIHGKADRIFPARLCQDAKIIQGATHSMVYTHAPQVSAFIAAKLKLRAAHQDKAMRSAPL